MTRLFIDLRTKRILYYTDQPQDTVPTSEHFVAVDYYKPLPAQMTLKNCFYFKYQDQQLHVVEHDQVSSPDVVTQNRTHSYKLLHEKLWGSDHHKLIFSALALSCIMQDAHADLYTQALYVFNQDAEAMRTELRTLQEAVCLQYLTSKRISNQIAVAQTADDFINLRNTIDKL